MRDSGLKQRAAPRVIRLLQSFRRWGYGYLSTGTVIGSPILHQPAQFVGAGMIRFEGCVRVGCWPSPYFLSGSAYLEARYTTASIRIGDGTWINNNFVAIAEYKTISVGQRVLIGTSVEIIESDFHGLQAGQRGRIGPENAADILIEDDVFIGSNVRILKGVRVGRGSVIGNGAVVANDVPAGVIAVGNPIRILRQI